MVISLQELLNTYKQYGCSDYEIIKMFFTKNKIEDDGVKLLTELAQEQIKFLHEKNSYFKEHNGYIRGIFQNKIPQEIALELSNLVYTMTFYRDLEEKELNRAVEIFNNYPINICPNYFVAYLIDKGVYKDKDDIIYKLFKDDLKRVIYRRDN